MTVTLEKGKAEESIIRRIFGRRKPRTSLTLNFQRFPESSAGPFAEYFNIDTSELVPGDYSIIVGIKDRHSGQQVRRACTFKLIE